MFLNLDVSAYDNMIVGERRIEKREPLQGGWEHTGREVDIVIDDFGIVSFDEYENGSFTMRYANPHQRPDWAPDGGVVLAG